MKTTGILIILFIQQLTGQNIEFNVSVNNDTLLLGNYLEVKFEINNLNGKFIPPDFSGWNIVAGPNAASSYSMINGNVKQSSSYTYYLEAPADGTFIIEEAILKTAEKDYKTPPVKIVVLDNPDGIRQHPKYKSDDKIFKLDTILKEEPKSKRKVIRL